MSDLPKMKCYEMRAIGGVLLAVMLVAIIALYGTLLLKAFVWALVAALVIVLAITLYNIFGTNQVQCPWDGISKD